MFQSRGHAAQWFNQMACAKMHRYRATGQNFLLGLRNFSNLTQGSTALEIPGRLIVLALARRLIGGGGLIVFTDSQNRPLTHPCRPWVHMGSTRVARGARVSVADAQSNPAPA